MADLRCVLVLLCAYLACVYAHAVLVDPTPLNQNPTTAQPCGVSTYPTNPTPSVTWQAGQPTTVLFKLVATDGGTSVTGHVDPAGKTNFQSADLLGGVGAMDQGLTTYSYTFTVPSTLVCNPICMFRMVTNSGWNSCTYVNVTCAGCPAPPPPPPKCKQATGLTFCEDYVQNTNVEVPDDTSVASLEANAKLAYQTYVNNTNVFPYGNTTTCQNTFHEFICRQNLVPCPGTGENISSLANCDQTCNNLASVCGVEYGSHQLLYDCKTFPKCLGENSSSFLSFSLVLAVASLLAALFL